MKLTLKDMVKYRDLIGSLVQSLSDKEALEAIPLFPAWRMGNIYDIDYRVKYNEVLYRCIVKHEGVSEAAAPDMAPDLWKQV